MREILPLLFLSSATLTTASSLYSTYNFNPLEHLTGIAPYFEAQDPPTNPDPPQGCKVDRAAYLVRHAAIYANDYDYETFIEPFVSKWSNHSNIDWDKIPGLNFLASWSPPISSAEQELLTRVGRLEATQLGVDLMFRYNTNMRLPKRVWTSSAERTYESAKALARALETDSGDIRVTSVYESEEAGADSLTPYKSCPAYSSSAGSDQAGVFKKKFTRPILARLNDLVSGFNFTADDIFGMIELCGYETVIRGKSPFCNLELFTPDEWLAWEYTEDIQYHYNVGYGNERVTGAVGLPWLNATAQLLTSDGKGDGQEDLHISFTHRELPPMVMVAMGLFNNSWPAGDHKSINNTMPLDRINHQRAWKSSQILPFLANLAIERLNCTGSYGFDDGEYYRVLVNSAPQPLPDCDDGPGTACSREGFDEYVKQRGDMFEGFSDVCEVDYKNTTDVLGIYEAGGSSNGTMVGKRRR